MGRTDGKGILRMASIFLFATYFVAAAVLSQFSAVHKREAKREQMEMLQMFAFYKDETEKFTFRQQLRMELPDGMGKEDVVIEDDYVEQVARIRLPGVGKDYFESHPLLGRSYNIDQIYMENGMIEIALDGVYEVESSVKDGYLCLDFLMPRQLYDKVVIVDAGHGGSAIGNLKQGIAEKDINLAIALQLKELLQGNDKRIGVYFTRTTDEDPSFSRRAQLGEKAGADYFISIHCNSSSDGQMSEESGTEVMYDETKGQDENPGRRLAQICLEEVAGAFGSKPKGVFPGSGSYVIRENQVTAVSIELGYMTNQKELGKLKDPKYQKLAAEGIYRAILRAIEEGL
ncbi:N-acetylmuramoyl-L-alanine amidase [Lachnospiraceae bacterium 29-84]